MAAKSSLIRGYAQALLEVAEAEGALADVEEELFRFAKALEREAGLREVLTDPRLPAERKRAVLLDLLGERASRHTLNLLGFLIEQGRARELVGIIEGLAEAAAERRERAIAEVRTAVPLTGARRKKLVAALSKATGRAVEVKVVVDPAVVGGAVARVGAEVFDGSIATRLQVARERLGST